MPKNEPKSVDLTSMDIVDEQKRKLKEIFPNVFNENKVDFDRLKLVLGEDIDAGQERYGMTWPGKAECMKIIQQPSIGTLKPAKKESVDFDTTENLFIEGDNLEVLKLLQNSYYGKIKMIYIDPPYNTGKEFIYPDKYSESLETYLAYTGQVDDEGKKFSTNAETDGRFHSKWLNMMQPRLFLARNLLREDGLIFISIDDHEVSNLRNICDEIYGEENFVAQFVWNTEGHTDNQLDVKVNHEYVVLYAKNSQQASLGHVVDPNTRENSNLWKGFAENSITKNGSGNPPSEVILPIGFPCIVDEIDLAPSAISSQYLTAVREQGYVTRELTERFKVTYPVRLDAMRVRNSRLVSVCRVYSGWANLNKLQTFIQNRCQAIDDDGDKLSFYLSENGVIYYRRDREKARNILSVLRNFGTTEKMRSELEQDGIPFQYPKPKELLRYLLQIGLGHGEVVLDFFAGSSTTAHAVLDLNKQDDGNRKFILVQLPELCGEDSESFKAGYKTIAEIGKERIRCVLKKINNEQKKCIKEKTLFDKEKQNKCVIDLGFKVFKLDKSNFNLWESKIDEKKGVENIEKQLELHINHIDPKATVDEILYELLLKSGFPLTTKIEEKVLSGKKVCSVENGVLLICLEKEMTKEVITEIARLEPARVICLDQGFAGNDQLKTNAVQIMKSHGVNDFRTV